MESKTNRGGRINKRQDMPMILFCGDPHGHSGHIIEAVQEHQPAAVILLGDLQAQRPLEIELATILQKTEVWFIHGNHDTDSEADHDHLFGSAMAERNLHGRVVEVAGLHIAGLGGVFRGKVWTPRHRPPSKIPNSTWPDAAKATFGAGACHSLTHRSTIFPDDYERLLKQRADILVTHEAPSAHPHGFAAIDLLPAAWVCKRLSVATTTTSLTTALSAPGLGLRLLAWAFAASSTRTDRPEPRM